MLLLIYDMLVNVNGCEQARWACSVGNSAIDNVCDYYYYSTQ